MPSSLRSEEKNKSVDEAGIIRKGDLLQDLFTLLHLKNDSTTVCRSIFARTADY